MSSNASAVLLLLTAATCLAQASTLDEVAQEGHSALDSIAEEESAFDSVFCVGSSIAKPTPSELSRARMPSKSLSIPDGCAKDADGLRATWERVDRDRYRQLSNQWCSHKTGWVEKQPGTCSAGGPPPICKVDHWQRSADSDAEWERLTRGVVQERRRELARTMCNCQVRQAQDAVGDSSAFRKVTRAVGDTAADQTKDWAAKRAIKQITLEFFGISACKVAIRAIALTETIPVSLAIDSTEVSDPFKAYLARIGDVQPMLRDFERLAYDVADERERRLLGLPPITRGVAYARRLERIQRNLGNRWAQAQAHLLEMRVEKNFPQECSAAIEASNSILQRAVSRQLSLKLGELGVDDTE